jgi:hypothetical protein
MKTIFNLIILILIFTACNENDNLNDFKNKPDYSDSLISISGLSLYWDHEVFGPKGRQIRFEFYDIVEHQFDYELDFRYILDNGILSIYLVDRLNHGKCVVYPSIFGLDTMCMSRGGFSISDTLFENGYYKFNLLTKDFKVFCDFNVSDTSYQLVIPDNDNFKSSIEHVYPIPKDIIFGSIIFSGIDNNEQANKLNEDFMALGLLETSLPNYPYRHLRVNDNGTPIDETWLSNNNSIGLLYKSNGTSFKQIVETANNSYVNYHLNIYLFSGLGDQARFDQNGIHIVCAGEY